MGPSVDDFTTLVSRWGILIHGTESRVEQLQAVGRDRRVKAEVRGLYEEYAPRGSKA
jgi:hypothetical protein